MHKFAATSLLLWSSMAGAEVLNVEFKFTPYTGDLKQDHVMTVPGKARVFLNNVFIAEQDIEGKEMPVLFDEREIAPAVWVPMASVGPALRKGANSIRIEFEPANPKSPYHAQLSWASVMDQSTETETESGAVVATNQSGEGVENKPATGRIVLERKFVADFASDRPWHHYPAVTELGDADRQQLAALLGERASLFKPDFAGVYRALEGREGIQAGEVRKAKCLDAAHAAGIRVAAPAMEQLVFTTTGNPEVVVSRKKGRLFEFGDQASFGRIKGDDAQMCAGMSLSLVYPAQLAFVRSPAGQWEVAY